MSRIPFFLQHLHLSRQAGARPGASLRVFLGSRILFVAMVVFAAVLLTSTFLYDRLLTRQARDTAAGIAGQTYAALAAIMGYGPSRGELIAVVDAMKTAHVSSPYRIEVWRAATVDARYGAIAQPAADDAVRKVMAGGGRTMTLENGTWTRHIYPLTAQQSCLSCHDNADLGAVLGVVEVKQNINKMAAGMRAEYLWLFVLYAGITFVLVFFVAMRVLRRVTTAVDDFRHRTAEINSIVDLAAISDDLGKKDFGFKELNQAFAAVGDLAGRLRDVAVDKDILEFEIKILNKFIITSNVVQDWQKFIKELLVDINTIIDTYALFAFFHENETDYELDVFWRSAPTDEASAYLEELIQERFHSRFQIAGITPNVKIVHHDCGSDVPLPRALNIRDIELRTKALFLDSPKVGGIVGIGVQSNLVSDSIFHIVLDSVLATLINVVGSVKAISKYTRDLEYYATRDPLTDLYNQRMFWELLEYEIHRSQRHDCAFALMIIDVDNFKTVNDRHGHAFGDFFLQRLADALRQAVRNGDFVARYGGDEFTIFLPETDREQAHAVAARIMEFAAALAVVTPDGTSVQSTVSIGMAMYPEHARNGRDLFLVADNMMYKVKDEGKNALAEPEGNDVAEIFKHESEINFQVYQALENQNVLPHFQPILHFASGEIYAHEVLMRIPTAGDKVLTAGEFIKAAERIGLLPRLDQVLMDKAFRVVQEKAYTGKLFVNLTPKALIFPDFLAKVLVLTRKYDINPTRVVFEVTERDTVRNVSMLQKFVSRMKAEGFLFAVDDFGSGYSSYKYLKLFPIDYVKIEGEFIRHLLDDADFLAYTKSIVTLARELRVKTVAEYVEDEAIGDRCRQLGIDFGQGYHIGRPAPELLQLSR